MKRNRSSGAGKKNIKFTACIDLMSVSKVCSFSKLMKNNPISKRIKLALTENKAFETKTRQKENSENVACKTQAFSLPTQIRIRATDREGNTFEVTYGLTDAGKGCEDEQEELISNGSIFGSLNDSSYQDSFIS